jgi:hypothetical protein
MREKMKRSGNTEILRLALHHTVRGFAQHDSERLRMASEGMAVPQTATERRGASGFQI